MLIDWFTVGAQALNFVILVWLMKRFLYQPILNAIDAREKRIAATVADAAAKEVQAQQERNEYQQKNAEFEQQRAERLQQVETEAKTTAQQLLQQAQQAADNLSERLQAKLHDDVQQLNQTIAQRLQHEVFAVARQALTDLANVSLEDQLVAAFVYRLQNLDAEAKKVLVAAINSGSESILIRSAFELDAKQQEAVHQAIHEIASKDIKLQFETAAELISGIELSCKGQKVAWSIAEYINTLEASIGELVTKKPKTSIDESGIAAPALTPIDTKTSTTS